MRKAPLQEKTADISRFFVINQGWGREVYAEPGSITAEASVSLRPLIARTALPGVRAYGWNSLKTTRESSHAPHIARRRDSVRLRYQ